MRIARTIGVCLCGVGIAGLVLPEARAQQIPAQQTSKEGTVAAAPRFRHFVSKSGVAVVTGDYGTNQTTTITELFETVNYRGHKGEVGLTVPYLFRNGGGTTPGESRVATNKTIPQRANGLGDLQLKGRYYWLEEQPWRPSVDLTGRVKIPTASEDDGLGTGGVDVGVGTGLIKRFGSLITLGDVEFVVRDTPSNSTLHSTRVNYSVGMGYPLTQRFTPYVFLDGSTPSSSGTQAPLEVVGSGVYKVTEAVSSNVYVLGGLTDGSPDFGAGASISVKF